MNVWTLISIDDQTACNEGRRWNQWTLGQRLLLSIAALRRRINSTVSALVASFRFLPRRESAPLLLLPPPFLEPERMEAIVKQVQIVNNPAAFGRGCQYRMSTHPRQYYPPPQVASFCSLKKTAFSYELSVSQCESPCSFLLSQEWCNLPLV